MQLLHLALVGLASARRRPAPRIVAGYEATPFAHRFMAAIFEERDFKCGGSLVQANAVLTAAHCVEGKPAYYRVKINRHNLTRSDSAELKQRMRITDSVDLGECSTFPAKAIVFHPLYYRTSDYAKNDLALVILRRRSSAHGIRLDTSPSGHVGELATVLGWGRPNKGIPRPSPVLMEARVPVVDQSLCEPCQAYLVQEGIELCAGFPEGTPDASRGDSGGPLFIPSDQGPVLVGITSWSEPKDGRYCPTVYVRVGAFSAWILENLP